MTQARILLTAPASGSGKTLITCGILQALVNRGMNVASFKCGPDYIDPMFHSRVIGTHSKNLDPFFADYDLLKYLFADSAKESDISVIEGVMGFYDGRSAASLDASTYDVSEQLSSPVILIVNCKGASISCVPIIKGFKEFEKNNIRGVILNNMSAKLFEEIAPVIEKRTGVKPLGFVPKVSELVLESRHLGLVMPSEIENLKEKLNALANIFEETIDIDALIEMANSAPELEYKVPEIKKCESVRVAIADDDAFCFMYEDNLNLLKKAGAEIVRFSPLNDEKLPDDIQGLILYGGYPELYAEKLASNKTMIESIRSSLENGLPCMAECGGFMYLHEILVDREGIEHKTVGFVKGKTYNTGKLARFGYIQLSSDKDCMILPSGEVAKAHEFHYWDSENCGEDLLAEKPGKGVKYNCSHSNECLAIGYPHLYYYSNPEIVYGFMKAGLKFKEKNL